MSRPTKKASSISVRVDGVAHPPETKVNAFSVFTAIQRVLAQTIIEVTTVSDNGTEMHFSIKPLSWGPATADDEYEAPGPPQKTPRAPPQK